MLAKVTKTHGLTESKSSFIEKTKKFGESRGVLVHDVVHGNIQPREFGTSFIFIRGLIKKNTRFMVFIQK